MRKRLIKKKIKQMSNRELNDCIVYETNWKWRFFAGKEFHKRTESNAEDFWKLYDRI